MGENEYLYKSSQILSVVSMNHNDGFTDQPTCWHYPHLFFFKFTNLLIINYSELICFPLSAVIHQTTDVNTLFTSLVIYGLLSAHMKSLFPTKDTGLFSIAAVVWSSICEHWYLIVSLIMYHTVLGSTIYTTMFPTTAAPQTLPEQWQPAKSTPTSCITTARQPLFMVPPAMSLQQHNCRPAATGC